MQAAAQSDMPVAKSALLDESLGRAHRMAVDQGHAVVSLDHLLFALTSDTEALAVLESSRVDLDRLRADIAASLGHVSASAAKPGPNGPQPGADLLRILQLAATAARQSPRKQIDGAIVLAAIIGDAKSPAAGSLKAHGLTFEEVIRVLSRKALPTPAQVPSLAAMPQPSEATAPAPQRNPEPAPAPTTTEDLLASVRARVKQSEPPRVATKLAANPPQSQPMVAQPQTQPAATPPPPPVQAAHLRPLPEAVPPPAPMDRIPPAPAADARPRETQDIQSRKPDPAPADTWPPLPDTPRSPQPAAIQPGPPPPGPVQRRVPPPLPQPGAPPLTPLPASAFQPRTPEPFHSPQPSVPTAVKAASPPHPQQAQPPHAGGPPPIQPARIIEPVDLVAAAVTIPASLPRGRATTIEIRIPRRQIDIARPPRGRTVIPGAPQRLDPPVVHAATLRLVAEDPAQCQIAALSPETIWFSAPPANPDEEVVWLFSLMPVKRGKFRVTLMSAGRTLVPFGAPDDHVASEMFEVKSRHSVRRSFLRSGTILTLFAAGFVTATYGQKPIQTLVGMFLKAVGR